MNKKSWLVASCIIVGLVGLTACLDPKQAPRKPLATRVSPELVGGLEKRHRSMPRYRITSLRAKYPGLIFYMGSKDRKTLALTFDDGPDREFTPKILDVLKRKKVKATFFVVGVRAKANPDQLKRIVREGHVVGNHTWDHPFLIKLPADKRTTEIQKAEAEIKQITGLRPLLFRPPYGLLNDEVILTVKKEGYKIIEWSVDTLDWTGLRAYQINASVLSHGEGGSIILQHCAGGRHENLSGTVNALPLIIDRFRAEGYRFVTVPELLGLNAYAKK